MVSLLFRNLLFTILQPGVVAGLVPYLLARPVIARVFSEPLKTSFYLGAGLFVAGLIIMLICIYQFAVQGNGTLSPADPTKELVSKGLYKYSRNPMYVGVMLELVGESIAFRSSGLWIYSLCVFAAFNIFILLHEEPRLKRVFGKSYEDYVSKVRRWL